jgi:probable HAF family extracellular repeat protein
MAAFFTPLGRLPGDGTDSAADVSADGSVVVGFHGGSVGIGYDLRGAAFRWTSDGGTVYLGYLPSPSGRFSSFATAVSADGSIVAGLSGGYVAAVGSEAFRWTSAGGMIGLGDLPGGSAGSQATGVSADGSVVVGSSYTADGQEAFRWTSDSSMVGLGDLPGGDISSHATGVSADGSVVVGRSTSTDGQQAFRWTNADGMIGLGDLPGGEFRSAAGGASVDGSVIVGSSSSTDGQQAFRWTIADGMVGLGDLAGGDFNSMASGVCADGSQVVGWGTSAIGQEAFVWNAAYGMRSISDLLTSLDVDLTGWTLNAATAISADGTTIVGQAINSSGQTQAWLANISAVPEPPAVASTLLGMATLLHVSRRVYKGGFLLSAFLTAGCGADWATTPLLRR